MTCCTRINPCPAAQELWERVAAAHHRWSRTRASHLKPRREREFREAWDAFEAHFVGEPSEQPVLLDSKP